MYSVVMLLACLSAGFSAPARLGRIAIPAPAAEHADVRGRETTGNPDRSPAASYRGAEPSPATRTGRRARGLGSCHGRCGGYRPGRTDMWKPRRIIMQRIGGKNTCRYEARSLQQAPHCVVIKWAEEKGKSKRRRKGPACAFSGMWTWFLVRVSVGDGHGEVLVALPVRDRGPQRVGSQ